MSKRKGLLILLAIFMVFVLVACGNGYNDGEEDPANGVEAPENGEASEDNGEEDAAEEELPVMTMEELAENDGRDGANAYVLVEGIVYDVTDSPRWTDGNHNGNQAGQDLTEEILGDSPHGRSVLDRFEAIARIEE